MNLPLSPLNAHVGSVEERMFYLKIAASSSTFLLSSPHPFIRGDDLVDWLLLKVLRCTPRWPVYLSLPDSQNSSDFNHTVRQLALIPRVVLVLKKLLGSETSLPPGCGWDSALPCISESPEDGTRPEWVTPKL